MATGTHQAIPIEVSPGELIDKISILQIKSERIPDVNKLRNVRVELAALTTARDQALPPSDEISALALELKEVNERIWEVEDALRRHEKEQRFDDDDEHGRLNAKEGGFDQRNLPVQGIGDGEREHDRGPGQHEQERRAVEDEKAEEAPSLRKGAELGGAHALAIVDGNLPDGDTLALGVDEQARDVVRHAAPDQPGEPVRTDDECVPAAQGLVGQVHLDPGVGAEGLEGDVAALASVLKRVPDINARNEHGVTALMRAAQFGHVRMVRALLEHGADANITRNDKFTALALAAFFGHTQVVRALMEHGADSQASTRYGTSPHMWATARTFNEVVNQLDKPAPPEKVAPAKQNDQVGPVAPSLGPRPAPVSAANIWRPCFGPTAVSSSRAAHCGKRSISCATASGFTPAATSSCRCCSASSPPGWAISSAPRCPR